LAVRQDRDVATLRAQVVRDAAADMVGEENVLAAELLQDVAVEVVRMTVREPDVFGVEDVALAVGRDAVAQSLAAEIGGVLVAEPRVGRKDRFVVIGNERRIARGRNAKHGISAIADVKAFADPRSQSCPNLANTRLRQS
jgi:hypothetical protein